MNRKEAVEKAVSIRSQLVMFCQQIPVRHIADEAENLIPAFDELIDEINAYQGKEMK